MVLWHYDEPANADTRANQIVIGAFCFMGFWAVAGFVAASLL